MDCGEGGEQYDRIISMSIVVKKDREAVEVTINSSMSVHLAYVGLFSTTNKRIDCQSTGLLEQEIFDYVK